MGRMASSRWPLLLERVRFSTTPTLLSRPTRVDSFVTCEDSHFEERVSDSVSGRRREILKPSNCGVPPAPDTNFDNAGRAPPGAARCDGPVECRAVT
jgi:hypothetical protein